MMNEMNTAAAQIPAFNAVDGFEPSAFTRQMPNEDGTVSVYLDVKFRMLWFRLRYPNGKLVSEIIELNERYAVVCCKVYTDKGDAEDQFIAKSMAQRFATQDKFGERYLELAETAAVGRALASAGFGTQFCTSADLPGDMMDMPIDKGLFSGDEEMSGLDQSTAGREMRPILSGSMDQLPQNYCAPQVQRQPRPQPGSYEQTNLQNHRAPEEVTQVCHGEMQPPAQAHETQNCGMTLEEAKNVMVDFGKYKGFTLGQIAMCKPLDLQWYVDHYAGNNHAVKAGAALLVNLAKNMAG